MYKEQRAAILGFNLNSVAIRIKKFHKAKNAIIQKNIEQGINALKDRKLKKAATLLTKKEASAYTDTSPPCNPIRFVVLKSLRLLNNTGKICEGYWDQ